MCDDIGYRGRRPVIETALPSPELRQMILDGAGIDSLRQQAVADGMHTLQEAALDLVRQGITTLQDIDRALGESARVTGLTTEFSLPPDLDAAAVPTGPAGAPAIPPPPATPSDPAAPHAVSPDPAIPPTAAASGTDLARALAAPPARSTGEASEDRADEAVRVLLADDDPIIRQIARTMLVKDGFAVLEVEDGVAALERLNSDHPDDHVDLMISDLDMPRLNGYDLLRLARATPRTAALPIVVLTGEEEPETEAKLIEEGADDYIRKPIDPVRFLARVKAVLRRATG